MGKFILVLLIIGGVVSTIYWLTRERPLNKVSSGLTLQLTSPVFANNSKYPETFTCDGKNINPPLTISGVPADTQSLALVLDDPDATNGTFTHWVVYNIPHTTRQINQNSLPGIVTGNSAGTKTYIGPCPPSGEHRYTFKLYAINKQLLAGSVNNKQQLEAAIKGKIIDDAELVGRYTKK
jgi:Raf kinase inhibitor-like YbhB/YbcL family protein